MRNTVSRTAVAVALAAAVSAVGAAAPRAAERCCFTNPRYTGVCVVAPGEGESCASILRYLNSAGTTGKGYCGSTDIRVGWRQVVLAPCSTLRGEPSTANPTMLEFRSMLN